MPPAIPRRAPSSREDTEPKIGHRPITSPQGAEKFAPAGGLGWNSSESEPLWQGPQILKAGAGGNLVASRRYEFHLADAETGAVVWQWEWDVDASDVDIRAMAVQMASELSKSRIVADAKEPVTIAFLNIENRTETVDFDSYNILNEIRQDLIENSQGKLLLLDRKITDTILAERDAKRAGQVATNGYKDRFGADYFLTGSAYSLRKPDASLLAFAVLQGAMSGLTANAVVSYRTTTRAQDVLDCLDARHPDYEKALSLIQQWQKELHSFEARRALVPQYFGDDGLNGILDAACEKTKMCFRSSAINLVRLANGVFEARYPYGYVRMGDYAPAYR